MNIWHLNILVVNNQYRYPITIVGSIITCYNKKSLVHVHAILKVLQVFS